MSATVDEIIVETVVVGTSQRVTAMDPKSLVEVVFQAPASAERTAVVQLARQKLAYRLARQNGPAAKPADRGGTLV